MKAVLERVNENAKPTIAAVALQRYKEMRENWLNIENMMCTCVWGGSSSVECCLEANSAAAVAAKCDCSCWRRDRQTPAVRRVVTVDARPSRSG